MPGIFSQPASSVYVAEVVAGLEDIAAGEIARLRGAQLLPEDKPSAGGVRFTYSGRLRPLLQLKTVIAVYSAQWFDIPRPKALLGHQHFQKLLRQIQQTTAWHPAYTFETFYISAAGSESAVMQRLKAELTVHTGLKAGLDEGDLWIRLRRGPNQQGWETLVRLTPRPLTTRAWRVRDMPGALNASVAYAMIQLTHPRPSDTCLNIACGSGTILIERRLHAPARQAIGCDINPEALSIARANLAAAGVAAQVGLMQADAGALPLPERSMTVLYADLPFGNLTGSHADNLRLYPTLLSEAARVAAPGAVFALITHEVRLMENLLRQSSEWGIQQVRMVTPGGLHPRIFLLERR